MRFSQGHAINCLAIFAFGVAVLASSPASADILIAVPGPDEGPRAVLAREIRRGVEAAAQDINAKGGVNGERLTVAAFNDRCSDEGGKEAAYRILASAPALVIGHPCANAALAAAPLYAKANVIFIAPAVRHPALTSAPSQAMAGLTFRLCGRDDRQAEAAAEWLLASAPRRAIAIVHDRTAYARAIADATEKRLKAAGVTPLVLTIVAGHREYPEIVDPVGAKGVEAMLFAGFPNEAALILAGLSAKVPTVAFVGSDSMATAAFAKEAAQQKNVVRVLYPRDAGLGLEARAKAALEVWTKARLLAGSLDPALIQKALRSGALATSQGDVAFDAEGDLIGPSYAPRKAALTSWVLEDEARGGN